MNDKVEQARKLIDEGKLTEAKAIIDELNAQIETQIDEPEVDEIVEDKEQEVEEQPIEADAGVESGESVEGAETRALDDDKEKESSDEDKEESQPSEKDDEEKDKKEGVQEKRMAFEKVESKELENQEVRGFAQYIRTKGAEMRDVTTVEAEAVIPVDRVTQYVKTPETVTDLRKHINVTKVNTASGSYPVLAPNKAVLNTVAELQANPKLADPQFTEVDYKVETYRGYIPMSREAIDDSDVDLTGLVANHVQRYALNTTNLAIANVLKTAPQKVATSLDDIKTLLNVTIEPAYDVKIIATQSFYNALDTMKDKQGQYLLQKDITSTSGARLLGREVIVISDTMFGSAGDKLAFIGDAKSFATMFNRAEMTVKWQDHNVYGEMLACAIRFDVEAVDINAGFMVALDDSQTV